MTGIVQAGKNKLSGQIQLWCVPHNATQMQLSGHDAHGIIGGSRRHLDHHVGAEDVRGEEYPEDVVDEQAGQQQRGHLQAGQTHKRYECHTQAHAHCYKKKWVKLRYRKLFRTFSHRFLPSISSQWPVSTHMHTIDTESVKLKSSAAVKRPQNPKENRFPSVHGLMMYWHMGSSRKASATVAITVERDLKLFNKATNSSCFE